MYEKIKSKIIDREKYLLQIKPFIDKKIIKVLSGQRRVGKSYLLFQIMKYIKSENPSANIIYINKEDLKFDNLKTATDLNEYVINELITNKKNYVFIDEIQDILDFEKALRSLVLKENLDIYCTGSNAKMLSSELSTFLSGRYIEIKVYSLSYTEFLTFHKLKDSDNSLEKYLKYGGLPYLIHLEQKEEIIFEYLKNIYTTIVYRDVVSRYNVRNTRLLEQLIKFLADNTGSLFSAKRISDFLKSQNVKISPNQIQTYIEYLTNSFLIFRVERYDIIGKRLFEIGEKYYFENLGIRNSIWGYRPEDIGKILENAVYNQLLFKGYKVKVGSLHSNEIDFIAEKNNEKLYIQVALSLNNENTIKREFENLLKINDNYRKIVITRDAFIGNSYNGIEHLQIRKFLLQ